MSVLMAELEQRWQAMFEALAAGNDVTPAMRLRTEGMMEAAVLSQAATQLEVCTAMEQQYRSAFGQSVVEDFGDQWREFFPFPQIPAMGRRAPVYPSTAE